MANSETVISTLVSSFQTYMKQQDVMMKKTLDRLDNKKTITGEKVSDLARRQKLREAELVQAKKGLDATQKLDDAIVELETTMDKGGEQMQDAIHKTVKSLEDLMKNSHTISDKQREEIANIDADLRRGGVSSSSLTSLQRVTDEITAQEKKRFDQQAARVKLGDERQRAILAHTQTINENIKSFFTFSNALQHFGEGLRQEFALLQFSMEHGVPAMDLLSGNLSKSAAVVGLSVTETIQTQAKFQQAVLASAGSVSSLSDAAANTYKDFSQASQEFFNVTGDRNKAYADMMKSLNLETYSAVKMSNAEMMKQMTGPDGLRSHFQQLSMMTGVSVSDLIDANTEQMKSSDMRLALLQLDEKSRKQKSLQLAQDQVFLVKQGMQIDQAIEATAAMQKLTQTMTPKDRYKEAVRMSVIMGAMGIKGADQLPSIALHPNAPGNVEKTNALMSQYQNKMGTMLGSNNFGTQALGGALNEKMQGQLFNTLQGLSTAGMQGRAPSADITAAIAKLAEQGKTQAEGLQGPVVKIMNYVQAIAGFLADPTMELGKGTIAAFGAVVKDVIEVSVAASLVKGGGGAVAGGLLSKAGGLLGRGAAGVGAGFAGAGILGSAAAVGGAGAVGYGAGKLIDMVPELFGGKAISEYGADLLEKMFPLTGPNAPTPATTATKSNIASPSPTTPKAPPAPPAGTATAEDTAKTAQDQVAALNRLSDILESHGEMTDDLKNTIQASVTVAKSGVDATKHNTEATKTNTAMTQTPRRWMDNADPGSTS